MNNAERLRGLLTRCNEELEVQTAAAAQYRQQRDAGAERAQQLRELLRSLEWAGTIVFDEWYDKGRCCPVCKGIEDEGHEPNCKLAEVLYAES